MDGRLFGLDIQLLFDICVVFVFIMILYIVMPRLFFRPVRAYMEQRKAAIEADRAAAAADHASADQLKAEYEILLKEANKEAESLMSASFKAAVKKQEAIVSDAKDRAQAIIEQAERESEQEKLRIKDEVKRQMAEIAGAIAAQFVVSDDPFREAVLLEETLKEMGGEAWQNS